MNAELCQSTWSVKRVKWSQIQPQKLNIDELNPIFHFQLPSFHGLLVGASFPNSISFDCNTTKPSKKIAPTNSRRENRNWWSFMFRREKLRIRDDIEHRRRCAWISIFHADFNTAPPPPRRMFISLIYIQFRTLSLSLSKFEEKLYQNPIQKLEINSFFCALCSTDGSREKFQLVFNAAEPSIKLFLSLQLSPRRDFVAKTFTIPNSSSI